MDGAALTVRSFLTPARIMVPKLVVSRDGWKVKADERKRKLKSSRVRVRDLEVSRGRWQERAQAAERRVAEGQEQLEQARRELDAARNSAEQLRDELKKAHDRTAQSAGAWRAVFGDDRPLGDGPRVADGRVDAWCGGGVAVDRDASGFGRGPAVVRSGSFVAVAVGLLGVAASVAERRLGVVDRPHRSDRFEQTAGDRRLSVIAGAVR